MNKDAITRSIGLSYVFLGGYYYTGVALIDKQTIMGFSIAAFMFIVSDFIQIHFKKYPNKVYVGAQYFAIALNAAAIIVMLIYPFINFNKTDVSRGDPGTTLLLLGLGVSIWVIAKKNDEKNKEQLEEYKEDIIRNIEANYKTVVNNEEIRVIRERMRNNKNM